MHSPDQSNPQTQKIVVLGIGNTLLSDDGVGIHVINELKSAQSDQRLQKANIQFLDGGTLGYLLIDRVSDADGVVIVDSANLNAAAGTVRVMNGVDVDRYLFDNPSSSVHEVGLIDLLQMMSLNNQAPQLRALVGIQPESLGWGTEMSPAVAACIPAASEAVWKVLDNWIGQAEKCLS